MLWYVEVSWGNLLAIHTETTRTQYFFLNGNIRFYDTFNENKPNLIYKHGKNDRIMVSLSVFMCPGVSWGILGCPGVIRTVIHWWTLLQTQHQALTLSSIEKFFKSEPQNRHRVWGPTHQRAIKMERKVAKRDWVDHQACSLLQFINIITIFLIM